MTIFRIGEPSMIFREETKAIAAVVMADDGKEYDGGFTWTITQNPENGEESVISDGTENNEQFRDRKSDTLNITAVGAGSATISVRLWNTPSVVSEKIEITVVVEDEEVNTSSIVGTYSAENVTISDMTYNTTDGDNAFATATVTLNVNADAMTMTLDQLDDATPTGPYVDAGETLLGSLATQLGNGSWDDEFEILSNVEYTFDASTNEVTANTPDLVTGDGVSIAYSAEDGKITIKFTMKWTTEDAMTLNFDATLTKK